MGLVHYSSDHLIENPVYQGSKRLHDYGYGFYTIWSIELAKEGAYADSRDFFVILYELDLDGLQLLRINSSKYNTLNWLAILMKYRSCWQTGTHTVINKSDQAKEAFCYEGQSVRILSGR